MLTFFRLTCLLFVLLTLGTADIYPFIDSQEYSSGELGPYPTQTFFSDLDVIAPVANVVVEPNGNVSHERFVTWAAHGDNIVPKGPQLLDAKSLSVVYQGPQLGEDTFGISVQACNGSDYLLWWAGTNIEGRASGNHYIFNSTYHLVWNVSAVSLRSADAHDIFLTSDCHVVFTSYQPKPFELESFGLTDNSWLLDSYFQEVDLATNELLFQWRASDHVDLTDSWWTPELEDQGIMKDHAWDFFHINSVQKDHRGNFLISARHTSAVYYINGTTGAIIWTLGGKRNDFLDLSDGNATDFSWQHHARWTDNGLTSMSLFDDRSCGYIQAEDPVSRGIIVSLNFEAMTVSLDRNFRACSNITSVRKGGMQVLENGNVLLGYGSEPAFTEFSSGQTVVWAVHFGPVMMGIDRETADNYRTYKVNWTGNPYWGPKIAAGPSFNGTPITLMNVQYEDALEGAVNDTAYFSWNGATKLDSWLILAANESTNVINLDSVLQHVNKTGFETAIFIGEQARYICAIAVSEGNELLGMTPMLDMEGGAIIEVTSKTLVRQYSAFTNRWAREGDHHQVHIDFAKIIVIFVILLLAIFLFCSPAMLKDSVWAGVRRLGGYRRLKSADLIESQKDDCYGHSSREMSEINSTMVLMSHGQAIGDVDVENR
ncbi:hypothetical protein H2198_009118 [Neophaeococcomyces mojaviensis]|uniref:Uncharacterized protein n=1 Tax=Neophaeococcomyces mojaviensis TaxID=3383035 RepID=A0ACC2ZVD7_9EURO|nr:hypothetical protein H2198_009118 [Knufia sp. JES_112]